MSFSAMSVIATDRLVLRPPEARDAAAIVEGLDNLNVSRWTRRIPFPYRPLDAEAFLALSADAPGMTRRAITHDGHLIGVIGLEAGEIGYWIAEPQWGQGYGREAARAMADHAFSVLGMDGLFASHHLGNEASRRILLGLGFVETGTGEAFSAARNARVTVVNLVLRRDGWQQARERRR